MLGRARMTSLTTSSRETPRNNRIVLFQPRISLHLALPSLTTWIQFLAAAVLIKCICACPPCPCKNRRHTSHEKINLCLCSPLALPSPMILRVLNKIKQAHPRSSWPRRSLNHFSTTTSRITLKARWGQKKTVILIAILIHFPMLTRARCFQIDRLKTSARETPNSSIS